MFIIADLLGGAVAMLLLTRLTLWLLKRLGDNGKHIIWSYVIAWAIASGVAELLQASPSDLTLLYDPLIYGLAGLPWLAYDLVSLRRRRGRISN